MPDLRISVDIDASGTSKGAAEAKAAIKGIGDEADRTRRRSTSILDIDFKAAAEKMKAVGETMRQVGQNMQQVGRSASLAITAPLAALATLGIKSALELDTVRTKITALTGSAEAANKKIIELRELSARSVGVTQAAALETFAQLKGIGGIAEDSINRVISAMGKLNAAFTIDDTAGFNRNLVQIFSQGFERADVKEAIGRVPIFEQILESAFGTKDPAKLNELKKAGKLTLDNFMTGISDAIERDPRIANIGENLTTKLAKGWEKLNVALAPLGQVILDVVMPIFAQIIPLVESAGKWFASLSPAVQTAIVAFGAVAAALGPVLIVLGSVVGAVGTLVSAFGAIAGAIGGSAGLLGIAVVITGIGVAIAPVVAWIIALGAAWTTNFGGIRELTATVAAAVEEAWNIMLAALRDLTQSVLAEVQAFWQENSDDIMKIVNEFSELFRGAWTAIVNFWKENHETIKAIAEAVWNAIKTIVVGAVKIIGDVIKLALAVINGDWQKGWDATKGILSAIVIIWKSIMDAGVGVVVGAVKLIFQAIWDLAGWVNEQAAKLGLAIVQGIANGISRSAQVAINAAKSLAQSLPEWIRRVLDIKSPSKVTHEIGEQVAQGLADGIDAGAPEAAKAASTLGSRMTDVLQKLLGGDLKDVLSRTIDVLSDSSRSWGDRLKTVFGGIAQNFRRMAGDMISTWLTTLLHLNGGGQGPGGTPYFNPTSGGSVFSGGGSIFGGGGGIPPTGTIVDGTMVVNGTRGGGLGSIFGSQGFGNNVGTYGAIGGIANLAGGLIGGRVGSYISNIGSGLATGAQIGSMILPGIGTAVGAAIGAAVGFFATLFGGDPKYKKDKKENLPQLNQGVADSLQQLRSLVTDIKSLRVNPDAGLAKAIELRSQIASGFGIQFQSKKGQRQAQQIIAQRLIEADALLAQIRDAADVARAAGDRDRRLLPEFAGGVYMSPAFTAFRRRNGFLGGSWTGRDTIPAMLAHGEMVLNPYQQNRVRAAAGFDVFKPAGIPGYAGGGMVDGGGGPISVTVNVSQDAEGLWHATAESDAGKRVIAKVVADKYGNDELKFKRRGA